MIRFAKSARDTVDERVAGHRESLQRMKDRRILIDGSAGEGILWEIFTRNAIGPKHSCR